MGQRLQVYKHAGFGVDPSNGGITRDHSDLFLVDGPDDPDYDKPNAVVLVERTVGGQPAPYLEPVHGKDDSQVGWMSGGAFASAFSGFASKVGFYGAVAIHDRQEVYHAMD